MNKINFIRYPRLDSTNQKLYQLADEGSPEFTVVSTKEQTQGKGQRGTHWESSANKNLTFSFLLRHHNFEVKHSFLISLWFSVYLHKYLTSCQIHSQIKWPNDIIINRKKVGGILIQNKIRNNKVLFSVIGLGLNVYQEKFNNIPNASSIYNEIPSFCVSLKDFEEKLMYYLHEHRKNLKTTYWNQLLSYYYQHLLGYKQVRAFKIKEVIQNGIIVGITKEGKLRLQLENSEEIKNFDIKELSLLY